MVQTLANIDGHRFDLIPRGMGKCEQQAGLAGVLGLLGRCRCCIEPRKISIVFGCCLTGLSSSLMKDWLQGDV